MLRNHVYDECSKIVSSSTGSNVLLRFNTGSKGRVLGFEEQFTLLTTRGDKLDINQR